MVTDVERRAELGEFLRSRRARLQPADLGLPAHGRRRVPGLRREELAAVAGVSPDHYVRLEQGRSVQFSAEVLDAVARALRLSDTERAHLHRLARPAATGGSRPPQRVRPGLAQLLDAMGELPGYVLGRNTDVLAWNSAAVALFTDFAALPAGRRNKARLVFLDEDFRTRYVDWPDKARDVVAYLRYDMARHPGDPGTTALVRELSAASAEFRALWAQHHVRDKTHGRYRLRHPVVGPLELDYETLRLPDDPDQALVLYSAAPGSPAHNALRLLGTALSARRSTR